MRKSILLACALILSSTTAFAAPLEEIRGCVTVETTMTGQKCTLLRTADGNEHLLVGRKLPPGGGRAVVLARGKQIFGGNCPLRIIVNTFEVRSWFFTRQLCPLRPSPFR